jgi:hypothetical protein
MNYPVTFRFKLIALAPQIYVTDATGKTICYVKQKLLRFREKVEVFSDDTRQHLLATIEADRIIDWSARYTFKSADGEVLGAVGRRGMKSLWKAHYDVFVGHAHAPSFTIHEENPWVKMLDGMLGGIPVLGMFAGYLLHPRYNATRAVGEEVVLRLTKQPAFFEGVFKLEPSGETTVDEEAALMLSFLMMNLLERARG